MSGDNLDLCLTCGESTSVLVTSQAFNKVHSSSSSSIPSSHDRLNAFSTIYNQRFSLKNNLLTEHRSTNTILLITNLNEHHFNLVVIVVSVQVYKAKGTRMSRQSFRFEVQQKALLSVLPDFMVCYAGANYRQEQTIHLESVDSNLIFLDWYSSGRIANQERWHFNYLHTSLKVYLGDELILREATTLEDVEDLTIADRMDQFDAFGLLVIYGNSEVITELRERVFTELSTRENYGVAPERQNLFCASQTSHGVCVVRFACADSRAAYSKIEKLLSPLFELYGGNPFHNKY